MPSTLFFSLMGPAFVQTVTVSGLSWTPQQPSKLFSMLLQRGLFLCFKKLLCWPYPACTSPVNSRLIWAMAYLPSPLVCITGNSNLIGPTPSPDLPPPSTCSSSSSYPTFANSNTIFLGVLVKTFNSSHP